MADDAGNSSTQSRCGAHRKNAPPCTKPAGWGTDHPGIGTCKFHGGSTPAAAKNAAKQIAISMGSPLDIEPHEALLTCVQITAGEVAYCTHRIQMLTEDSYIGNPETHVDKDLVLKTDADDNPLYDHLEQVTKHPVELNIWIKTRQEAMDRLSRYAKMALDAGVEERRVRLAENMAMMLAPILEGIFKELGLTPKQREAAPAIVERNLLRLESSSPMAEAVAGASE